MPRLAILADIHGNLTALQAVTAALKSHAPDYVVVAGDLINVGPQSVEVLEHVFSAGWTAIRGNHEQILCDAGTARLHEKWAGEPMLDWLVAQFTGENRRWQHIISGMPDTLQLRFPDAPPIRVAHGIPGDHWQHLYPITPDDEVREMLAGVTESVVILAHTHLPMARQVDDWLILNPGAVGLPRHGEPLARYLLLDGDSRGWQAKFCAVPCDVEAHIAAVQASGLHGVLSEGSLPLFFAEWRHGHQFVYAFWNWYQHTRNPDPRSDELAHYFLANIDPDPYRKPAYQQKALQHCMEATCR